MGMAQAIDILSQNIFLNRLNEMRVSGGKAIATGINDELLKDFLVHDVDLQNAIHQGFSNFQALKLKHPALIKASEKEQITITQESIVNFYAHDMVSLCSYKCLWSMDRDSNRCRYLRLWWVWNAWAWSYTRDCPRCDEPTTCNGQHYDPIGQSNEIYSNSQDGDRTLEEKWYKFY